jgi:hypothetical protein
LQFLRRSTLITSFFCVNRRPAKQMFLVIKEFLRHIRGFWNPSGIREMGLLDCWTGALSARKDHNSPPQNVAELWTHKFFRDFEHKSLYKMNVYLQSRHMYSLPYIQSSLFNLNFNLPYILTVTGMIVISSPSAISNDDDMQQKQSTTTETLT